MTSLPLTLVALVALGHGLEPDATPDDWWPLERVAEVAEASGADAEEVEPSLRDLVDAGLAREVARTDGSRYFRATPHGTAAIEGEVSEVESVLGARLDELGGEAEVFDLAAERRARRG